MKPLLLLICLSFSFYTFSQNNSVKRDWHSDIYNKRILKWHYPKHQTDSLVKLINLYVDKFYCNGIRCNYTKLEDDYYVSIKMRNSYIKIKYYFTDFDVLKMDELMPKIERFSD